LKKKINKKKEKVGKKRKVILEKKQEKKGNLEKKDEKKTKKFLKKMHCGLQYNAWVWVNNDKSYNASLTYCNCNF